MSRSPSVQNNTDGSQRIDLGWLIKSVIIVIVISGLGLVWNSAITVPSLADDLEEQEIRITRVEDGQKIITHNQIVIDEQVRGLRADSSWAQEKLNALLEAAGVTKRIKRPQVEDSELGIVE